MGEAQPRYERLTLQVAAVNWEDVEGLHLIKHDLERCVAWPLKYYERFGRPGVDVMAGFILHGPLGCGKVLVAKSVAREAGVSFMSIKVPDFFNVHGGQSPDELHKLLGTARAHAPIFFVLDEVDVLKRGTNTEPLLKQLITELDKSYDHWGGVIIIGATNRPEMIDRDLMRPDRFAQFLHVPLPCLTERGLILRALTRNLPVDTSVNLGAIANSKGCEYLNGADLKQLVNEAIMAAVKERLSSSESTRNTFTINKTHFETALKIVCPSVSGVKELSCLINGAKDKGKCPKTE